MTLRADSPGQLTHVAKQLLAEAGDASVWCFYGEMGAGKTTLIKALCHQLGVADDMGSPTFAIVNEYRDKANNPIYHFDFYRIKSEQEAADIGTEEYFDSGHRCFVEWPELVPRLLPPQRVEIRITLVDTITREFNLTRHV
jgi:tRNA threonylcarbamoyladenosine biosynthesis protein TsaE